MKTKELVPAEICFREAVHDVRKDKTSTADDVVLCLESLAGVLQMQAKTQDATPLYKKSLHILQKAHGKKSEATVPTLIILGNIFNGEAQYRKSARYYQQALSIVEIKSGRSNLKFADLQHHLGLVLFKAGCPERAEKLYSSSLDVIMNQKELPSSDLLEDVLSDYTHLLRKINNGEKILPSDVQTELLKDRIGDLSRTKNVEDSAWSKEVSGYLIKPDTKRDNKPNATQTETLEPSFGVDKRPSDFAAADQINKQRIDFYQRMIAIDAKTLGEEHPSMARDLTGLAYVYILQKKYDQAKILIERALKIYQSAYGSDPLLVQRSRRLLELIECRKQSDMDTRPIQNYLATLQPIPIQAQNLEIALRLSYLALLVYSQGKIEDAQKILAWTLSATALSTGEQSILAGACLNDYARVLRSAGHSEEANRYEHNAYDILTDALIKQSSAIVP